MLCRIKFYRPGADVLGVRYRGVEDLQSIEQFMNGMLGNNAEVLIQSKYVFICIKLF